MSFLGISINELTQFIGAIMVESLLYGVHLVLFCIASRHLWPHEISPRVVLLVALVMLFALATADVALSYRFILKDLPAVVRTRLSFHQAVRRLLMKNALQVTGNLIADGLLIYRFYMVWNRKHLLIVLPVLILSAETVWGYISQLSLNIVTISHTYTPVYLWSTFAFNIVMTLLTAGRIWWVARKTHAYMENPSQKRRYNTAIAILVESGALYSISILLVLAVPTNNGWHYFTTILPYRLVGIVPTLMVVQVELKRNNLDSPSRTRSPATAVSSTVISTVHADSSA